MGRASYNNNNNNMLLQLISILLFEATYEGRVVGIEVVSIGVGAISIGRAVSIGQAASGAGWRSKNRSKGRSSFFLATMNFLGLLGRYWERNFFLNMHPHEVNFFC